MYDPARLQRSPRRARRTRAAAVASASVVVALLGGACVAPPPPGGPYFPGTTCLVTPANSVWRSKVDTLPVHPNSANWIANSGQSAGSGANARLKADFGSGLWDGEKIGIPFNVVDNSTPTHDFVFDYDEDSDHVPYPIASPLNIEGGGDKHILSVNKDTCRLYETWNSRLNGSQWEAGSGATWSMTSNAMRPDTLTSADAAGLQILPGLVRYDEAVTNGVIPHAIRMTIPHTQRSYQWPASHQAGDTTNANYPKMGAWLRLKATVDVNSFDPYLRPIIQALKTYGGIIADNGSPFYMSGAPDEGWDNDKLALLNGTGPNGLKGSDFEYVDTSSLKVADNSYQSTTAS